MWGKRLFFSLPEMILSKYNGSDIASSFRQAAAATNKRQEICSKLKKAVFPMRQNWKKYLLLRKLF
ncbi:MAG: hypothetical protein K9K80_02540 [Spirochaetia bacterium]|nr:hypothetical protein [Spirochaetia bacterium]